MCGRGLCNLGHRRQVFCICMLYQIHNYPNHVLCDAMVPMQYGRLTTGAASAHKHKLGPPRVKNEQFTRLFVPSAIRSWNAMPRDVFNRISLQYFKEAVDRHLVDLSS